MKARKTRYKSAKSAPLPTVDLSQPLPELAATIGRILKAKRAPLYRMGNKLVTVNKCGKLQDMTPERFVVWIGKFMSFTCPGMDAEAAKANAAEMVHSALILPS